MSAPAPIPVIVNPMARSELSGKLADRIKKISPRAMICPTEHAGHASTLAYDLVKDGHKTVVAAGGDGTIHEAANGLLRANIELDRDPLEDSALGVLPTGTMNVFALELGMNPWDLRNSWRIVEKGNTRTVDLWRANEHIFVQLAGVGFDAEVIRGTTWEQKKKFGPLSYAITAMSLIRRQHPQLEVHVPGRDPIKGATVLVGNGRRYGGPVVFFDRAVNDDGLLDVIVLRGMGYRDLLRLIRVITIGGIDSVDGIEYFRASEFSVNGAESVGLELDGELVGETPVKFSMAERQLRVKVD